MIWMLAKVLHQFVDEWWALYMVRLAPSTLHFYAGIRDRYLIP